MQQIIGNDLAVVMKDFGLDAKMVYKTPQIDRFRWSLKLEVWEMSDTDAEKLFAITDDEWTYDNSWFRTGACNPEAATETHIVNGAEMIGLEPFDDSDDKFDDMLKEMYPDYYADEDEDERDSPEKYLHFMDYMEENQRLTAERNVVVIANGLAEANGMTVAEFLHKYYT